MFTLKTDFFIGLGIYTVGIILSTCVIFFTIKRYKATKKPPILHTLILSIHYSWLVLSLVMVYYKVWYTFTYISLVYLISIAPIFKLLFISKYYHLKNKTTYYRNIYWSSVFYLMSLPIWLTTIIVLEI